MVLSFFQQFDPGHFKRYPGYLTIAEVDILEPREAWDLRQEKWRKKNPKSKVYQDPNDKIQWMQVDYGDGTKTVVPYNSKGPHGQQSAPQGAPQRPVGKLKPYGGPSATPTGGFR